MGDCMDQCLQDPTKWRGDRAGYLEDTGVVALKAAHVGRCHLAGKKGVLPVRFRHTAPARFSAYIYVGGIGAQHPAKKPRRASLTLSAFPTCTHTTCKHSHSPLYVRVSAAAWTCNHPRPQYTHTRVHAFHLDVVVSRAHRADASLLEGAPAGKAVQSSFYSNSVWIVVDV